MTITSSLNAGVMGLNVNATRLATISNNIANSATYGYKRNDVDFSSLVIDQRRGIYAAGGVTATAVRDVSDPGALISTGRATDLAVNGQGMLPVTNFSGIDVPATERDFMMVPTGGFTTDADGFLRTESGLFLMGWEVDDTGAAITGSRSTQTGLVPVNITGGRFDAEVTSRVSFGANLPGDLTEAPVGTTFELPIEYYNEIGLPQGMNATFTRTAERDWTISVSDNSTGTPTVVGAFDIQFNSDGTLGSVTPSAGTTFNAAEGEVTMNLPSGPIDFFVGRVGTAQGLSQIGTKFQSQDVTANGSPAGELQSLEMDDSGRLQAIYSTGARRTLFQIPVATVNNPDALTPVGSQAYAVSGDSGGIYLWDAGDGPAGGISGYALMESNTDIAAELTSLIETQRAYSSNAKIVQTVDEMLQETTNLKR